MGMSARHLFWGLVMLTPFVPLFTWANTQGLPWFCHLEELLLGLQKSLPGSSLCVHVCSHMIIEICPIFSQYSFIWSKPSFQHCSFLPPAIFYLKPQQLGLPGIESDTFCVQSMGQWAMGLLQSTFICETGGISVAKEGSAVLPVQRENQPRLVATHLRS